MATLNEIKCESVLDNTGVAKCPFNLGKIKGAFQVPTEKTFTQAELDDLRTTLEAGTLAPLKDDRIFPLHNFEAAANNSEDVVWQTLGYGKQVPVRDGDYRLTFTYRGGGLCLHKALRKRNFSDDTPWLFYDDKFQIIGWRREITTGVYGLAGVPAVFFVPKWTPNDGANETAYTVYFSIDPYYWNDAPGFVKSDFPLTDITGLRNVNLVQSGTSAAGVFKVIAKTGCDAVNMYDKYSTQLGVAAAWTLINTATGAAITITSVAPDANIKGFTVTAASADPDYPATATGKMTVNLVDPTALEALGVDGFEGIPLTVLRGA